MAAYICVVSLHERGATRGCVQTSEKVGGKTFEREETEAGSFEG